MRVSADGMWYKELGLRGDSRGGSQLEKIICRDGQDEEIV
jgi:hypothetical protein